MLIFLARILADTTKQDIADFMATSIKGGLFSPKGELVRVEIIRLQDRITRDIETHAIVQVEPDKVATRVIFKLNRTKLNGKLINVRQYFIRNRANDRRRYDLSPPSKVKKPRLGDRRRDLVEVTKGQQAIKFSGDAKHARKIS